MKKIGILLVTASLFLTACQQGAPLSQDNGQNVADGEDILFHTEEHQMEIKSDQEFLEMMIPHHQEAVDSSKVLLAKTSNEELKNFLEGVIYVQSNEIEQMKLWYKQWFGTEYQAKEGYMAMMPDLSRLEGEAADRAYIQGMIDHHQSAIAMARDLQAFTERPELIDLAKAVMDVQSAEIGLLEGYLNN
ncbi:DUF305 domain-containing protein [Candidatus Peregrinibacteria bacterium]|nr:DUF305 domain-containing protein [Candidatus Peregrinibacteria bacterium]